MSNVTKGISIALIILLVCMTVAYIFALPSSATLLAKAEEEITYKNAYIQLYYMPLFVYSTGDSVAQGTFHHSLYDESTLNVKITLVYDEDLILFEDILLFTDKEYTNSDNISLYAPNLSTSFTNFSQNTINGIDFKHIFFYRNATSGSLDDIAYKFNQDYKIKFSFPSNMQADNTKFKLKISPITRLNYKQSNLFTLTSDIEWASAAPTIDNDNFYKVYAGTPIVEGSYTAEPLYDFYKKNGLNYDAGYENGYTQGMEQGETIGYQKGLIDGYDNGYDAAKEDYYETGKQDGIEEGYNKGYAEGYNKGSFDVNANINEIAATGIGASTDFIMKILDFEVAGISLWGILGIIGGVIVLGIIIKLVYSK